MRCNSWEPTNHTNLRVACIVVGFCDSSYHPALCLAAFATNTLKSGTQMIGRENGKTGTISKRGGTQRRGGGPDPLTGECLAGALGTVLATKTMPVACMHEMQRQVRCGSRASRLRIKQ